MKALLLRLRTARIRRARERRVIVITGRALVVRKGLEREPRDGDFSESALARMRGIPQ